MAATVPAPPRYLERLAWPGSPGLPPGWIRARSCCRAGRPALPRRFVIDVPEPMRIEIAIDAAGLVKVEKRPIKKG